MRFVLMTEPQQGMSYADQLAITRRAEDNGFDAFFRSDHFASFPGEAGQPTTDAWTVVAGLARDTERIGLGVLVAPVTFRHPGDVRQGRHDRRRDERRPDRGRGRRGLERDRASPARPRLPGDQGAGRPDGGPAGHPPRAVGRAGRLVVRGRDRHQDRGRAVPAAPGGRARTPAHDDRRRPAPDHHRRSGLAPVLSARRPLRRRVQPVVVVTGQGGRGRPGAGCRVCRDRTRSRRRWRARRWPACSSAATATRSAPASGRC